MIFWEYLLAISLFIVFYNYAGYAIIADVLTRLRGRRYGSRAGETGERPSVTFIVAAYNEEDCIEQKILNCLEQNYPPGRIEFLFVTDGSTDRTPEIVRRYPSVRLLHEPSRNGKSAAMNRAVGIATNEILIFSDANTLLNADATANITRHYADEKTGGVSGEKKVILPSGNKHAGNTDSPGGGEGAYWKYESRLKKIDSDFYSVVGAAGELFSLRRTLYVPLEKSVILDDFVLSLRVALQGYRIQYEPEAYAMELPSFSLEDERKRKVRIAAGGFQSIWMLSPLLAFWRQPALSYLYISHRVLRWAASPFCLVVALVANALLVLPGNRPAGEPLTASAGWWNGLNGPLFAGQLLFYGLALTGWALLRLGRHQPKAVKLPYYFVFMNISVIRGFFRFLRGGQSSSWEKARRVQAA